MKRRLFFTAFCMTAVLALLACAKPDGGTPTANGNASPSNTNSAVSGERSSAPEKNVPTPELSSTHISVASPDPRLAASENRCGTISCSDVTTERFDCIKREAQRFGLSISANSGTVTTSIYSVNYSLNTGTKILTMDVTKKPANISCDQLIGLCGVVDSNCSH